ncbi:hypothetical protein DEI81_15505 [Curtobacterium sp. MCBD17_013]|uniref:TetR family transcriptional regulator C-terminal domain-containing protein n=1 Tax=unclassified Curtobacterium TaxID=257496 RepID=UPI000DA991FA|nr:MULTISPECIES: TetR family transcriptional regulator C-terminal domain-containing protein [unclassified Curtobacterium]PZF57229.1 hypothetical protein DEI81_15505 [Curtobacterium sp. MCBD17_013]WIB66622.1 TetR family transcriptional regulator C-terminal domain-containing protein [Curtobacterium sp. MCBD17_035]
MTDIQSHLHLPLGTLRSKTHDTDEFGTDEPGSRGTDQHTASDAAQADRQIAADSRVQIIDGMIRVLQTTAFHEVTAEAVAAEAGLTLEALRHHFPSWDGLVLATLDRWNSARMTPLLPTARSHGTIRLVRAIMADNAAEPSLMRFLVALLSIAATPGHALAPMLQHRYRQFHLVIQQSLVDDVEAGREPQTMQPARGAEQLIALYEGLQLQAMVRPSIDLLGAFDRAITRMRDGWGRRYVAPVWEA